MDEILFLQMKLSMGHDEIYLLNLFANFENMRNNSLVHVEFAVISICKSCTSTDPLSGTTPSSSNTLVKGRNIV